ncbi:hypothetical protein MCUN1_002661 [Malassezia cuniculi]|uniref:Transcription factor domain-containing protein n=1 Tax=Malassezia cuniculi TaxID=948313 RepID=A0AAF0ES90_9BASI|nr:hypothetical protein MCUN1_002661 [Malassezia cuniculi]
MREIGRKIWNNLLTFDWQVSAYLDHCYAVSESNSFTDPPSELDDTQVLRLDVDKNLDQATLEQRLQHSGFCDNTFLRVLLPITRIIRMQVDIENKQHVSSGTNRISEKDLWVLDGEYRRILQQLPPHFNSDTKHHFSRLQLNSLIILIYYRLLRLHFVYLSIGLRDPTHRKSAEMCVDAARNMIKTCLELEQEFQSNLSFPFLDLRLMIATLSLHVVLCRGSDFFSRQELLDDLCVAIKMLTRFNTSNIYRGMEFLDVPIAMLNSHYIKTSEEGAVLENVADAGPKDPLGWLPVLDSRDFMIDIDGLNELWSLGDSALTGVPLGIPQPSPSIRTSPVPGPWMAAPPGFL